jgi:hypothetical protein
MFQAALDCRKAWVSLWVAKCSTVPVAMLSAAQELVEEPTVQGGPEE